jgi:phage terminase small subunit
MAGKARNRPLTQRQRRFCEEYVIDCNGAAAYIRAGYRAKNGDVAGKSAYNLLKKVEVQAYLAEARAIRGANTQTSAERILTELRAIAYGKVTDVVSVSSGVSTLKDTSKWSEESQVAIQEVIGETERVNEEGLTISPGRVKVKAYDKMRALEILAKHAGLTNDFDSAVATLKTYGIDLKRDAEGKFHVA